MRAKNLIAVSLLLLMNVFVESVSAAFCHSSIGFFVKLLMISPRISMLNECLVSLHMV